jgi:hypothetical protein
MMIQVHPTAFMHLHSPHCAKTEKNVIGSDGTLSYTSAEPGFPRKSAASVNIAMVIKKNTPQIS